MEKFDITSKEKEVDDSKQVGEIITTESITSSSNKPTLEERISKRKLLPRQVSLIGIGGAIGTGLFVSIGTQLTHGGGASLLIAFCFWTTVFMGASNSIQELCTFLPVSGSFVHYTERFVDESCGFAIGWVYYLTQNANLCFELTAICLVIEFWTSKVPKAVWISVFLILYVLLNCFSLFMFGEGEFYLSMGKVILAIGLIIFTIVVMAGGNPEHKVLGFHNFAHKPFVEYLDTGSMGKFHGFMACLIFATYVFWGIDYLSLAAQNAIDPRKTMPRSFNKVLARLVIFYIGGALCVGILLPSDDQILLDAISEHAGNAAASPYTAACVNLKVSVLPHIINALILTSIVSAGNSSLFSATKALQRLALSGKAPKIFAYTTRRGVPIYCVGMVLIISLLAYLNVSNGTNKVLTWFLNVETAGMLIVYIFICISYLRYRAGLKAQGFNRDEFIPYKGWGLPFFTWWSLFWFSLMLLMDGYTVFLKGNWDIQSFVFSYFMIAFFIVLFVGHKIFYRKGFIRASEMDFVSDIAELAEEDEYWRTHGYKLTKFDKAFGKFL